MRAILRPVGRKIHSRRKKKKKKGDPEKKSLVGKQSCGRKVKGLRREIPAAPRAHPAPRIGVLAAVKKKDPKGLPGTAR